ncbi:arylalkylamine N-acetyltransferase 1-like isoform X2 [Anticarsia gemmatalis]|uniref:arylalkylamine N-acetyltransferase 1-like isoform X2 n=1 Tax=Anticarsia gemmatalis TaxID=129554 RepID=UPI003F773786
MKQVKFVRIVPSGVLLCLSWGKGVILSMNGSTMSQPSYEVKLMRKEDADDVMELLRRTFFIDEPMNQAVGLCAEGSCAELDDYCVHALDGELSFKAVDKEGNIVGVMINEICPVKENAISNTYLSNAQSCQNPKFQKILYVLAKREDSAKIWERFPHEENFVDVKIAATDPKWRKRGIMNELLKATEKLTTEKGIRLLRMDTSSAYSAMTAERLGFTCISSTPYLDIKMDGRPIIVPEPPHVNDSVYVKLMNI